MYKQNIRHIQAVILPLDGIILDLNRYRYNYYHHLCEHYHISCSKEEFYQHLGNMYDMYKGLPLGVKEDMGPLNAKIEREMFEYLHYKGLEPRKGLLELIEYLHQKDIRIAVMSTHRTRDAIAYLKSLNLYKKIHCVVGSDSQWLPLPSTQILEHIEEELSVQPQNCLVISSFYALNLAANQLQMNVIYCDDLVEAGQREKETSYKYAHDLFDVLNVLLFDQYDEMDIYSPILGMNKDMSHQELDEVREHLQTTYQDDPTIVNLIDKTYAFHVNHLDDQHVVENVNKIPQPIKHDESKKFVFDDEFNVEETNTVDVEPEMFEPQEEKVHIEPLNEEEEMELTQLLSAINKNKKEHKEEKKDIVEEKVIEDNHDVKENQEVKDHHEVEEEKDDVVKTPSKKHSSFTLFDILILNMMIIFIGIVGYVTLIDHFDQPMGIFRFITIFYYTYVHFVYGIVETILNGLHSVLHFIPHFDSYYYYNAHFSLLGMDLLNIFVFQVVVMYVVKIIIMLMKKGMKYEKNI